MELFPVGARFTLPTWPGTWTIAAYSVTGSVIDYMMREEQGAPLLVSHEVLTDVACAIPLPDDTIQLKDVARLDLKPGDTLVVTLAGNPTAQEADQAHRRILATLGDQIDERHLLVIPETAKLSILREDSQP